MFSVLALLIGVLFGREYLMDRKFPPEANSAKELKMREGKRGLEGEGLLLASRKSEKG
jgi:hypothetical protein